MATTYVWTGGTDNDLTVTTNYSPNGTPGNTDTILFPASVTTAPNANMDGLADTLALIHVSAGATYDIGSSGQEFQAKVTKIIHLGRGALWYDTDGNTADANIFLAPGTGGSANIILSTGATGGQIYCMSGTTSITGVGATDLITVGKVGTREATVTIGSGVGTTTDLIQRAGLCRSSQAITRLSLAGGTHEKLNSQEAVTVYQSGGRMMYDATDTVTLYVGMGGTADFTRGGNAVTVTTMAKAPDFELIYSDSLTTLTTLYDIPAVN